MMFRFGRPLFRAINTGVSFFLYALPALSQENKLDRWNPQAPESMFQILDNPQSGFCLTDAMDGIDEWKQPAKEALEGGRGMFCILPLAKNLVQIASQSINLGVSSAIKAAENPQMFSLQMLQSALDDGVRKCKGFILNKNTLLNGSNSSSNLNTESNQ